MKGPWSITEAYAALNASSHAQRQAETAARDASKKLALAEKAYRVALKQEMVRLHAEEKVAWTACEVIAKGVEPVAKLRYERDVARAVAKAMYDASFCASADRRDTQRMAEWSMRRELAEHGQPDERLAWTGPRAA